MTIFTGTATGTSIDNAQPVDTQKIRQACHLFLDPDHHVFLQQLPDAIWSFSHGGNADQIIKWASEHNNGSGIYFGINPVPLLDRPTVIDDIMYRRWLLIDIDRNKDIEPKNPATDEEHERAKELNLKVYTYLDDMGFPSPIQVDSGNGYHLYYRIKLPKGDESRDIVSSFLKSLDKKFSGELGDIDTKMANARCISKLPGTWSRRGARSKERPWRLCQVIHAPKDVEVVSADLLKFVVEDCKTSFDQPQHTVGTNGTHQNPSGLSGYARNESSNTRAYALGGLEKEQAKLAATPHKNRNNQLFKSTANLFQMVARGWITEREVIDAMWIAACDCGLDKDDGGEKGIRDTIASGQKAGMSQPRKDPDEKKKKASKKNDNENTAVNDEHWSIEIDDQQIAEGKPEEFQGIHERVSGRRTFKMYTIGGLMRKEFPEPTWVINGILSEGLNILAGKPKQGKSMMALNLAITIAAGGMALGDIQTTPGDVLYLSLEDKARRVKQRAFKMMKKLGNPDAANRLTIATDWPRQSEGGLAMVEHWYNHVERPVLLIIDVWGMFKAAYTKGGSQYEQDSQQLGAVKQFVDRREMSNLTLMHCRKGASDDVVEEVTGTMGLTGVADGIIVLNRIRNDKEARIFITGRDVQQKELALEFDDQTFTWKCLGSMDEHVEGKLQTAVFNLMKSLRGNTVFAKQISEQLNIPANSIRKTLERLRDKGLIRNNGNGWMFPGVEETGETSNESVGF